MPDSVSVVGYGTFITRSLWKNKKNVQVCKVMGYKRIFPEGNWFPYVLPSETSSFWALKFDVNEEELKQLDYYEGVHADLYKREKTQVELKNGELIKAFIYVPTEKTIESQDLSEDMDNIDRWQEEIKAHPEIVEKFPELVEDGE
ncbi:MAG: hypothetical protein BAJALOKI2v1_100025 [Promethearchaeota archaeon]|nr:MAG: hypothetical protein BAJALOKI2v1_100025 [Candidatus Lokiarchaeota archaeon]